jgi:hypothetical protein
MEFTVKKSHHVNGHCTRLSCSHFLYSAILLPFSFIRMRRVVSRFCILPFTALPVKLEEMGHYSSAIRHFSFINPDKSSKCLISDKTHRMNILLALGSHLCFS